MNEEAQIVLSWPDRSMVENWGESFWEGTSGPFHGGGGFHTTGNGNNGNTTIPSGLCGHAPTSPGLPGLIGPVAVVGEAIPPV